MSPLLTRPLTAFALAGWFTLAASIGSCTWRWQTCYAGWRQNVERAYAPMDPVLWASLGGMGIGLMMALLGHAAKRDHGGRCAACGYDLAGLARNAPCPECGAKRPEGTEPGCTQRGRGDSA